MHNFKLDQALAEWRRQMAADGIKSPELLDELESHLRDDIAQQVSFGADAQRAFDSAVLRLGRARALQREFAKSGGAGKIPRRRFTQILCLTSAAFIFLINTWTLVEFDLSALERAMGLCIVVMVSVYVASVPFLGGLLSRIAHARLLGAIKILSLCSPLVPIWAILTACHAFRFEIGIIPTLIVWLLYAAIAISAFAFGFRKDRGWGGGPGGPLPPSSCGPQSIPPGGPCPPDFGISVPPANRFAPIARQSLEIASAEAARLGHDYIGTEHVLLGVLKLAPGAVASLLQKSNVHGEAVRMEIERLVSPQPPQGSAAALPLTPRARKALRFAGKEARTLNQPLINVEHILLGLRLEGGGVAALALKNLGIRIERIREEISRACAPT
jgi:Clp amino terminal domain, pathogenicity island component